MVTCIAIRVWINRVIMLPILLVVSRTGKLIFPCPRSRLRTWSHETGSAVPSRVSLLTSIPRLNIVLTYGIPPEMMHYNVVSVLRFLLFVSCPFMAINVSKCTVQRWASPRHYTVDPMSLPSGNPFIKCHQKVLRKNLNAAKPPE